MIKISIVSYLNSKLFLYGLEGAAKNLETEISLDIPAICSEKLISNQVDVGLIPIATLPQLSNPYVISDFCIGADGKVASVLIVSEVPIEKTEKIFLDFHSRTSVKLAQILCRERWKIKPEFIAAPDNFMDKVQDTTAAVIIGDRALNLPKQFAYQYDLAFEWKQLTGLPFVFACWVSNKKLPDQWLLKFNDALKFGIDNQQNYFPRLQTEFPYCNVSEYLTQNIQFVLDERKKQAMDLFLKK